MPALTKTRRRVANITRGLLDTSVLIDLSLIDPTTLPDESRVSALSLAELAAGPHAAPNASERAKRQNRLQQIEGTFSPLPFDSMCARSYGLIYAAILDTGRKARGPRAIDLMIAATASAYDLPLYTRNAADLKGIENLVKVIAI